MLGQRKSPSAKNARARENGTVNLSPKSSRREQKSRNWSGDEDTRDEEEKPRQSRIARERAELRALREVGSASEWEQFIAEEEADATWENFEKWLNAHGWKRGAIYTYHNADGFELYQAVRFNYELMPTKKKFELRHRFGNGEWIHSAGPVRLPYNLPEMLARSNDEIALVEGEKAVDYLKAKGFLASCVQGQNWTMDTARPFRGRTVNVVMDNDDAGRENAKEALYWLGKVGATVRVIFLPDLAPEKGLDDWLEVHEPGEYEKIVANTKAEIVTSGVIVARPYQFPREEDIEAYEWLLGRHLLRGQVAGTAATGSTGKSNLSLAEALSMTSGRQLLHDGVPHQPLRVVLVNLEDNRNTMEKRLAALMRRYELTPADIGNRLFIFAKEDIAIKVATELRGGYLEQNDEIIDRLVALMKNNAADVLSIDSFIRTHSVNENDNNKVQKVIECFERVATKANCAVHLWHHTRKGNGDKASVESARGAQAFVDACRSVRILEKMTTAEHANLKKVVPELKPPGYYFRSFNGKLNFAPPVDESNWFSYESVLLRNSRGAFDDEGDSVGVVTPWQYPKLDVPPLNAASVDAILKAISKDGPWRANFRAKAWVGIPVAEALSLDLSDPRAKKVVSKFIDQLERAGKLIRRRAKDSHGEERDFIIVSADGASAEENRAGKAAEGLK